MVDINVQFLQPAAIELLVRGEQSVADFNVRIEMSGMDTSSFRRWGKHFKDGNMSIQDEQHGHPQNASIKRYKETVVELII